MNTLNSITLIVFPYEFPCKQTDPRKISEHLMPLVLRLIEHSENLTLHSRTRYGRSINTNFNTTLNKIFKIALDAVNEIVITCRYVLLLLESV